MKVTLRMSPQLHAALAASALDAGCSLNSFAIQVLAAAAGHRARFRAIGQHESTAEETRVELRELPRRTDGVPRERPHQYEHLVARDKWLKAQLAHMTSFDAMTARARHDREDPWFFVEWENSRKSEGQAGSG